MSKIFIHLISLLSMLLVFAFDVSASACFEQHLHNSNIYMNMQNERMLTNYDYEKMRSLCSSKSVEGGGIIIKSGSNFYFCDRTYIYPLGTLRESSIGNVNSKQISYLVLWDYSIVPVDMIKIVSYHSDDAIDYLIDNFSLVVNEQKYPSSLVIGFIFF
ncbi:MAG: hypothetical protein HQK51_13065 [Oligoflexia bacterium]|nr:hypothetical protein [Oligoflexia bacterium]